MWPGRQRALVMTSLFAAALPSQNGCRVAPIVRQTSGVADAATRRLTPPTSLGSRRMFRKQTDAGGIFAAIWDTRPNPVDVQLEEWPLALSGRTFSVQLRDVSGKVIRSGVVQCDSSDEPYCLFEVRTDCPELPESYHNKWILAVAFSSNKKEFDFSKPLRWSGNFKLDHDNKLFNYVTVEPVKWEKDYEKIRVGYNILSDRDTVEFRFAEKAMSIAKFSTD